MSGSNVDYDFNSNPEVKELVRVALEREALRQRESYVSSLKKRIEELMAMDPVQYVRRPGLRNLCPNNFAPEVLKYLGVLDDDAHFRVNADSGNEGLRLEVCQNGREWDNVRDPWEVK